MKIQIKGNLPDHVKDLGVKWGDVFDAEEVPGTRLDAVRFIVFVDDGQQFCTVLPDNYIKIQ